MTIAHVRPDPWTVAAVAVLAMCVVTFDHEALGHGGACLALGGHIRVLTSSIFRCDLPSIWVSPAGPACNLLGGLAALLLLRVMPPVPAGWRLFLVLVTCLSFYWEAGYVIHAMYRRDGDLYFAGRDFLGEPSLWWRIGAACAGVGLYLFTTRWASRAFLALWPDGAVARRVAMTAWACAAVAAAGAAAAQSGADLGGVRDAVLEIGAAAFPLLFIPAGGRTRGRAASASALPRSPRTIAVAAAVYAVFVATLGRGLFLHAA
jgi:hypothetical protein